VGSNPTKDMDMCAYSVFVCCPAYRCRPCEGLIPVQGVLPTVYKTKKLKKRPWHSNEV
jgi:hypothetical protein